MPCSVPFVPEISVNSSPTMTQPTKTEPPQSSSKPQGTKYEVKAGESTTLTSPSKLKSQKSCRGRWISENELRKFSTLIQVESVSKPPRTRDWEQSVAEKELLPLRRHLLQDSLYFLGLLRCINRHCRFLSFHHSYRNSVLQEPKLF